MKNWQAIIRMIFWIVMSDCTNFVIKMPHANKKCHTLYDIFTRLKSFFNAARETKNANVDKNYSIMNDCVLCS